MSGAAVRAVHGRGGASSDDEVSDQDPFESDHSDDDDDSASEDDAEGSDGADSKSSSSAGSSSDDDDDDLSYDEQAFLQGAFDSDRSESAGGSDADEPTYIITNVAARRASSAAAPLTSGSKGSAPTTLGLAASGTALLDDEDGDRFGDDEEARGRYFEQIYHNSEDLALRNTSVRHRRLAEALSAHPEGEEDLGDELQTGDRVEPYLRMQTQKSQNPQITKLMGLANEAYVNEQYQEAVNYFLEVIRLRPNYSEPYKTLSMIYDELRMPGKASEFQMLAAVLEKKNIELWKRALQLSLDSQNDRQALFCLTKAHRLQPKDPELLFQRATIHLRMKQFPSAIADLQKVLALAPHHEEARRTLRLATQQSRSAAAPGSSSSSSSATTAPAAPLTPASLTASEQELAAAAGLEPSADLANETEPGSLEAGPKRAPRTRQRRDEDNKVQLRSQIEKAMS
jgi:tetratricopeptide (TPR) repeat protein